MRFIRLSQILAQFYVTLQKQSGLVDKDLKASAARLLVADGYSKPDNKSDPVLLNIAALVIRQGRLTVHRLLPEVVAQVNETDIRALPADPPRLLRSGAFCIEAADMAKPLYGDVICLGGYETEGKWWLIMFALNGSVSVGVWEPQWGEGEVTEGLYFDPSPFVEVSAAETYRAVTTEGVRCALTLGALLDAEGSPIESATQTITPPPEKRTRGSKPAKSASWVVRNLKLMASVRDAIARAAESAADHEAPAPGSREGLHAEKRTVRGFLRRQPFGIGRSERKWIYVAAFESVRHVGQKPLRVNVSNTPPLPRVLSVGGPERED